MEGVRELAARRSLAVVNQNDELVDISSDGEILLRASHVFVFDRLHRVLLQQTGPDHRHPDLTGSSVAGFVRAGESYLEAAERRMGEEIGLVAALSLVGTIKCADSDPSKFAAVYRAKAEHAAIRLSSHVAEISWWQLEDIKVALRDEPGRFTPTFPYTFDLLLAAMR